MNIFLLFIVSLLLFLFYHLHYKRKGWPPGPMPLPFLGNLIPVAMKLEQAFLEWKRQYGPVYSGF